MRRLKARPIHLVSDDGRCAANVSPHQQISGVLVGAVAIAAVFRIHPSHARRLARQGRLPCYRIGNQLRFDLEEVKRWCRGRIGDGDGQISRDLSDGSRSLPHSGKVPGKAANLQDSRRGGGRQGNPRPNAARASGGTPSGTAENRGDLDRRISRAVRLVPLPHPR